jgi:hypothetical protein
MNIEFKIDTYDNDWITYEGMYFIRHEHFELGINIKLALFLFCGIRKKKNRRRLKDIINSQTLEKMLCR